MGKKKIYFSLYTQDLKVRMTIIEWQQYYFLNYYEENIHVIKDKSV